MKPNNLLFLAGVTGNSYKYGVFGVFLYTILLFSGCTSLETPINRRVISDGEFKEELSITTKTPKALPKRSYFWFKSQDIYASQNDYAGLLLDGAYTKYYHTNELAEKGDFKKGLKTDKWTAWYKNGSVSEVSKWKKGRRTGKYISRDSLGNTITYGSYKKGVKTGFWINQKQGDTLYYHKGKEITMDSTLRAKFYRPSFFQRTFGFLKKKKNTEELKEGQKDTIKTGFFKRLFKKKEKKTKEQKAEEKKKKLSQKERAKLVQAKESSGQKDIGVEKVAKDQMNSSEKPVKEKLSREQRKAAKQREKEAKRKKGKKVAQQKGKDSRKSVKPSFFKRLFGEKEKKSNQNETND